MYINVSVYIEKGAEFFDVASPQGSCYYRSRKLFSIRVQINCRSAFITVNSLAHSVCCPTSVSHSIYSLKFCRLIKKCTPCLLSAETGGRQDKNSVRQANATKPLPFLFLSPPSCAVFLSGTALILYYLCLHPFGVLSFYEKSVWSLCWSQYPPLYSTIPLPYRVHSRLIHFILWLFDNTKSFVLFQAFFRRATKYFLSVPSLFFGGLRSTWRRAILSLSEPVANLSPRLISKILSLFLSRLS